MRTSNVAAWIIAGALGVVLVAAPVSAGSRQAKAAKEAATASAPVNINTATQAELEKLPGVGAATAKKIIAGRPYASVADLSKAGVSKGTITKITPLVMVGAASVPAQVVAPKPVATAPAPTPASAPVTKKVAAPMPDNPPPVKGMVWVNLESKVFHREGDRYYGKTKRGQYMNEADALKAGYREAKTSGQPKKH